MSAIPKETYIIKQIITIFSCTKNRVQQAKKWRNTFGSLGFNGEKIFTQNRIDLDLARHMLNFLIAQTLDVAYGTSFINFSDGSKQLLPRLIFKLSKSHTMNEYNKYCKSFSFKPLPNSTLWQILKTLKPGAQHAMVGLDADGLQGFKTIKNTIANILDVPKKNY